MMIEVQGLTVRFQGLAAVDQVSLSVARGEAVGVVGESGSGKSTLLRAIAGLLSPDGGRVMFDGRPVVTAGRQSLADRRARARLMQMVFQDPSTALHPRHTVDRILAEPLVIHGVGEVERRIAAAMAAVGLDASLRFRFPHQLSGGQRQRVAIARALILEPRVLLLDEPTSALDVSVQAEVLNLLDRLRADHGLTLLMVGHDLAVVAHLCTRALVMHRGRAVEELTRADIHGAKARDPYTQALLAAARDPRAAHSAAMSATGGSKAVTSGSAPR
ncbi:ABC transporter ATP-binding protein [Tistrella mobilis]|uniref:ABC transporter ATP-binding protein n=1 Tax=Tistrella mobilis TaxID=171437 RepID=UPI00068585B0|nr:ABC transporter ATP-binding protein [Tistrella mobilis]